MPPAETIPSMTARAQFLTLLIFDTLIGLGLTAVDGFGLGINLVYSHCIGLCIWLLIQAQMLLFIRARQRQWRRLFLAVPVAAAGGYLVGSLLAQQLLALAGVYTVFWVDKRMQSLLLLSMVAGAVLTYYFMSRERLAQERQATEVALRRAAEARLRLLESQLEPHMLFNTLSNLRVLIASDPPRAQAMLDHLTAYLRATLGGSLAGNQSLQAEFARLGDYLELIAIRMGERLRYTLELPPALAHLPVPALLLQPLVENAVLHGLEPAVAGGQITVRALRQNGMLQLSVEDSGVGLPEASLVSGFGLQHVRERLHSLHGAQAGLELRPRAGGGTQALVRLPEHGHG